MGSHGAQGVWNTRRVEIERPDQAPTAQGWIRSIVWDSGLSAVGQISNFLQRISVGIVTNTYGVNLNAEGITFRCPQFGLEPWKNCRIKIRVAPFRATLNQLSVNPLRQMKYPTLSSFSCCSQSGVPHSCRLLYPESPDPICQ